MLTLMTGAGWDASTGYCPDGEVKARFVDPDYRKRMRSRI
jgi:hypothetical protein